MRLLSLLLLAATLSACVTTPVPPMEQKPHKPAPAESTQGPAVSLEAQLVYSILLGEIALQRQQFDVALEEYTRAAYMSRHPLVIERATQIAIYTRRFKLALELSQLWVEVAPDDMNGRRTLALLYLQLGQPDEAMSHIYYLIDNSADPAATISSLSQMLLNEPNSELPLFVLGRMAERYPDNLEIKLSLATLYYRLRELDKAQLLADEILKVKAKHTEALQLKGMLYREQGQQELARQYFLRAAESRPDDISLWQAYATLLVEYGDVKEALKVYRKLERMQPNDSGIRFALAMLLMENQRLDEAREVLRDLSHDRFYADNARYFLGYLAEMDGDLEQARLWYEQVGTGNNYYPAKVRLGFVLLKQKRYEELQQLLTQLKKEGPDASVQIQLMLLEGEMLTQQGEAKKAYRLLSKGLNQYPDHPDLLYARALVADKLGRLDWLERDLRKVLEKYPDDVQALNALGYTLADQTERLDEAYALIERALQLAPDEPAIMDSMGWVLFRMGRYSEAVAWLEKAVAAEEDELILAHFIEALWQDGQHKRARKEWQRAMKRFPDSNSLMALERLWQ